MIVQPSQEIQEAPPKAITHAVYLYFFLLLFEGALRKWILPQFSDALLLIRDPVAIYILYAAWKFRIPYLNSYVGLMTAISFLAFYFAMLKGHGNLWVALYGLRITILHFPLIFIIGHVFDKENVERIASWMIVLCIPMLVLTIIQFYSPQTSWINKGIGEGGSGAGFSGALGYYRPPGIFSFTNGLVLFFSICSSFIYWSFTERIKLTKWISYAALFCLILSIPFCISRALFFSILITTIFYLSASFKFWLSFFYIITASFLLIIFVNVIGNFEFIDTGINVFKERFTAANESEGGMNEVILDRFLGGLGRALVSADDYPFWGLGLGLGTNAGSFLQAGKIEFLIAEGEWGRVIGEVGPLIGLMMILIRVFLGFNLFMNSYRQFITGNMLPWLLVGNLFILISQGQWAQPTSLGFSVFFSGILLASLKLKTQSKNIFS